MRVNVNENVRYLLFTLNRKKFLFNLTPRKVLLSGGEYDVEKVLVEILVSVKLRYKSLKRIVEKLEKVEEIVSKNMLIK